MNRSAFEAQFRDVFSARFASVFRYLNRLSGDRERSVAAAEEAFVRLHRQGAIPDDAVVWLSRAAHDLMRAPRRPRTVRRNGGRHPATGDPAPDVADALRGVAREALNALPPREQQALILGHEGHSYRQIAATLSIEEEDVGPLLVRAAEVFRHTALQSSSALE